MVKAEKRQARAGTSSKPQSEARRIADAARHVRRQLGSEREAEFARIHGEYCAPIVRRIVGPWAGSKRIAASDLPTLATIALTEGDVDGLARRAVLLEVARSGGVNRRSLSLA
jgi:hypothetical protein